MSLVNTALQMKVMVLMGRNSENNYQRVITQKNQDRVALMCCTSILIFNSRFMSYDHDKNEVKKYQKAISKTTVMITGTLYGFTPP